MSARSNVIRRLAIAALVVAGSSFVHALPECAYDAPEGYDGFAVFMANGEYPVDTPPSFVTDEFFLDVMGWSPAELDLYEEDRLALLSARFGIEDPADNPDVVVLHTLANPDNRYRAYQFGSCPLPEEGWELREGAVMIVVINPDGIELGGQFAGMHVPVDTSFAAGIYNVVVTEPNGTPTGEEIVLHFDSSLPIFPQGPAGYAHFSCNLHSEIWGEGLAQGIYLPSIVAPGVVRNNIRNVVTFSSLGGL